MSTRFCFYILYRSSDHKLWTVFPGRNIHESVYIWRKRNPMTSHNHVQKNFSLKNIFSAFYAFAGTLARNCTFGGLWKEMLIISYNLSKEQLKKDC